ncbi:hypothetical protein ASD99_25305 [Mesorhizobium sp. Root695]|jgi:hypothetical protein|uniref:hypothetical protein n=1 Tax=unclassified Mesorhizobium TaxID=325217 RepID=UPI0006FD38C9|nr:MULTISPECIES: hypothetical protein [unclassified Mesorhizobium]KQU92094.1 hypothetical protein ASD12_03925 [Mesorhizobium sp. Root102]KRB29561.1 hypothetical protein ASD99_25305 [Mesorhizobium sp. Root695]
MTALLRNAFLAAVAVSALAGPALADQTVTSCATSQTNDLWSGRCCGAGDSSCLGGGNNGHDHNDNGGRGNNGGTAGKK